MITPETLQKMPYTRLYQHWHATAHLIAQRAVEGKQATPELTNAYRHCQKEIDRRMSLEEQG